MSQQPPYNAPPPRQQRGNPYTHDRDGNGAQQGGGERSPYGRDRDYEPEHPEHHYAHQGRQGWRQQERDWEKWDSRRDEPFWPEDAEPYGHGQRQGPRGRYERDDAGYYYDQGSNDDYRHSRGYRGAAGHPQGDSGDYRGEDAPPLRSGEQWPQHGQPGQRPYRDMNGLSERGYPNRYRSEDDPRHFQGSSGEADVYRPEQYSGGGSWSPAPTGSPHQLRYARDHDGAGASHPEAQYSEAAYPGVPGSGARGSEAQKPAGLRPAGQRPPVNHRGRAPKGYTRSDERIREDLCERLSEDPRVDASDISVSVQSGLVTLEGSIADRSQKHRVEDIADACNGVCDVYNRLSVAPRQRRPAGHRGGPDHPQRRRD